MILAFRAAPASLTGTLFHTIWANIMLTAPVSRGPARFEVGRAVEATDRSKRVKHPVDRCLADVSIGSCHLALHSCKYITLQEALHKRWRRDGRLRVINRGFELQSTKACGSSLTEKLLCKPGVD